MDPVGASYNRATDLLAFAIIEAAPPASPIRRATADLIKNALETSAKFQAQTTANSPVTPKEINRLKAGQEASEAKQQRILRKACTQLKEFSNGSLRKFIGKNVPTKSDPSSSTAKPVTR